MPNTKGYHTDKMESKDHKALSLCYKVGDGLSGLRGRGQPLYKPESRKRSQIKVFKTRTSN